MSRATASGRDTPGLRAILDHPLGPTLRQLDYWVAHGFIVPDKRSRSGRAYGSAFPGDQQLKAITMARLVRRGFTARGASDLLDAGAVTYDLSGEAGRIELDGLIIILLPPDRMDT